MSYHTHTPAEWAEMVSLAVAAYGALSVPYFVLVDAGRTDFPRLWQAAVYARRDVVWAVASARHELAPVVACVRHVAYSGRELARDVAALLFLLTARPEATR